jgi:hypothetical protein
LAASKILRRAGLLPTGATPACEAASRPGQALRDVAFFLRDGSFEPNFTKDKFICSRAHSQSEQTSTIIGNQER